jgi:hypothetical protein
MTPAPERHAAIIAIPETSDITAARVQQAAANIQQMTAMIMTASIAQEMLLNWMIIHAPAATASKQHQLLRIATKKMSSGNIIATAIM